MQALSLFNLAFKLAVCLVQLRLDARSHTQDARLQLARHTGEVRQDAVGHVLDLRAQLVKPAAHASELSLHGPDASTQSARAHFCELLLLLQRRLQVFDLLRFHTHLGLRFLRLEKLLLQRLDLVLQPRHLLLLGAQRRLFLAALLLLLLFLLLGARARLCVCALPLLQRAFQFGEGEGKRVLRRVCAL